MRIGVDANVLQTSLTGIGWYVWQVLGKLAALAGKDQFFLYSSRPLDVNFCQDNICVRMRPSPLGMPNPVWRQVVLRRLAQVDRLDCFWGPAHRLPLLLPGRIRAVLTLHDLVFLFCRECMERRDILSHLLYFRSSLSRADAIITVSAQTKRDLVNLLSVPESRVAVIHQGVDEVFQPLPEPEFRSRLERLGINGDYLLAVGTLEPRKNYPLLFRALAQLPPDIKLVVAGGWGWKYEGIVRELRRLNLGDRVRLLGYVPTEDLIALYNGATLYVLTSVYEGFGLPIIQAMACGLPVLVSNTSSLPEIGGDAAAYFESGSLDSLVTAIRRLLDDRQRRADLRARGLARARVFTWERTARRTLAILRGCPPNRHDQEVP